MKTNLITKQGRLSKVWANHFRKNRSQYVTWLQDGRDDIVSVSVVKLNKGEDIWDIGGRSGAYERAIYTFNIKNDYVGLSDIDLDFIDVFGRYAQIS